MRRHWVVLIVGTAVVLSLVAAGCTALVGGQTVQQATKSVSNQSGVADGSVRLHNYRSGFTSKWAVTVEFAPSAAFDRADKEKLVRNLLRIAWSVNEHRINGGVSLAARDGFDLDMIEVVQESKMKGFVCNKSLPQQVTMPTKRMRALFGEWPGRYPATVRISDMERRGREAEDPCH